jgi:hypothetical protein
MGKIDVLKRPMTLSMLGVMDVSSDARSRCGCPRVRQSEDHFGTSS